MAQSIFDALSVTGGMTNIENQSAIQSILESQPTVDASAAVEDDDVFQCGKCKKQFTSLSVFVTHKQGRCTPALAPPPRVTTFQPAVLQGLGSNNNSAFSVATPLHPTAGHGPVLTNPLGARSQIAQSVSSFNVATATAVSQSPVTQLTHSMVLTDDQILALSDLGQSVQNGILQGSTLHLTGNTVQPAAPFLSQLAQLTPRVTSNVTILSPIQSTTSLAPSNGSAFTSTVTNSNLQPVSHAPQHVTLTSGLTDKPAVQHIIKPSSTKPGRRSLQTTTATAVNDLDAAARRQRVGIALTEDGGKKKLVCTYCQKVFTKNFDLQQHIRSHTGEKPFQCVVCGRAFAQKSNVKKHMATHKVWPSGAGNTLPSQPPALLVPVEENGKAQVTITTTNPPVVQHHIPEQGEGEEAIDSVEKVVEPQQGSTMETQNYKVKVVIDNSYLCQYCPEKFKSYYQLKSHMVKHKGVQVYRCVVKKCEATFQDLDAFLDHTTTHSDELTYRCHQCNKSFSTLFELGLHQYSHSLYQQGNKSGPRHFQCTKCLNKYATPEALEHHMNTVNHKFPCPHCQKNFTCERFLRRHLVSHGTEAQYECPVCKKTFKTEHYLKNHALIHTGEKPYQCDECGATFNRSDKLKRHNLIHDKRVRFKCPFKSVSGCEKEFNRPDKLKAHIITHSGIKPFACSICGKEFGRRPHLKEHERAHRAEYPYKCARCERGFFRPKLFREHKCEAMTKKRVFHPRRVKRKPGRPRKVVRRVNSEESPIILIPPAYKNNNRVISATALKEKQKEVDGISDEATNIPGAASAETEQGVNVESDAIVATVPENNDSLPEGIHLEGKPESMQGNANAEIHDVAPEEPKAVKKAKKECYVKLPAATIPVSMVEQHYVTVHLTGTGQGDVNEIQAQLIPTGDLASQLQLSTALQSAQISPSSSTPIFHPLQIIDSQPVTLTMTHNDQLGSLGVGDASVIDIPVDIVTVTDERTLVCTQEVTSCGDSGEQAYATIADYETGEAGDVVLHGSESLMNSVEILQPEAVEDTTDSTAQHLTADRYM